MGEFYHADPCCCEGSPCITREIMNVSRKKNRMYRKAVAHKNNVNLWNKYKDLRALVKRMTKTSYNDYIQNLSDDCKLNPKRFWSFVKSKREFYPVNVFKQGDSNFSTSHAIANAFNAHFQGNVSPQRSTVPHNPSCDTHPGIIPLDILHVNEGDVLMVIKKLNSSKPPGADGISSAMLKLAGSSISPVLTKLFNFSLSTGAVPQDWKLGNVFPLFKNGEKSLITNYRPISLCSVPCKILEGFVSRRLLQHSAEYNIIPDSQHGFQPKHSCITQLTTLF